MYQIGYLIPSKEVAMTESKDLVLIKPITEINLQELSEPLDIIVAFSIILNVALPSTIYFKLCFEDTDGNELSCSHFLGEGEPKDDPKKNGLFHTITLEVPFSIEPTKKGLHFLTLEATIDSNEESEDPIIEQKKVPVLVTDQRLYNELNERDNNEA